VNVPLFYRIPENSPACQDGILASYVQAGSYRAYVDAQVYSKRPGSELARQDSPQEGKLCDIDDDSQHIDQLFPEASCFDSHGSSDASQSFPLGRRRIHSSSTAPFTESHGLDH